MTYRRFEDLPVWNDAIKLATAVFAFTATGRLRGFAGLRDQMERAAVSISNNIAEGFERGTNKELLTFLYIARGSAGEVRSMLCLILRLPGDDRPKPRNSAASRRGRGCIKATGPVDRVHQVLWLQGLTVSDRRDETGLGG